MGRMQGIPGGAWRRIVRPAALLAAIATAGCGGGSTPVTGGGGPSTPSAELTAAEVQSVVQMAAEAVNVPIAIAVTDRAGTVLAVYRKAGTPATSTGNFSATVSTTELALSLARTGAFFSNDQAPLSSRTVRYISGIHFPPGITNAANAALYGIENTNRGCPLNVTFAPGKAIAPARSVNGATTGLGPATGKVDVFDSNPAAVNPGGVPLYKNGRVVGGIGVAGAAPDVAEFAAFSGAAGAGFGAAPAEPGVVIVDGVALPFVNQTTRPAGLSPGTADGAFDVGPLAGNAAPEGDLVVPQAGPLGGLTAAEVRGIVDRAIATANITRAVIRLPIGQRARFAIAVADLDGRVLALHRMADATVFSIDVAVAKARNLAAMSGPLLDPSDLPGVPAGTALTNRTISFGAQPLYPPGIDGTASGPFFDLYQYDVANPCTNGRQPASANQNGVVFFPGSVPLYKGGQLAGALGISGDGVEQDDYVSAQAAVGFEPAEAIRADQIEIRGARLPYLKFPRNPTF